MPSLSVPFVATLLQTIFLVMVSLRLGLRANNRMAQGFIAYGAIYGIVIGLRWDYPGLAVTIVRSVLEAGVAPLTWLCLTGATKWRGLHAGPVLALLLINLALPVQIRWDFADFALCAINCLYAFAFFRCQVVSRRLAWLFGVGLLVSALVDGLIASDFSLLGGEHAQAIVAAANMFSIPLYSWGIIAIGRRKISDPGTVSEDHGNPPQVSADDIAIAENIRQLLIEQQLFRDPNLTLQRLARRSGIPARRISSALNRVYGRNMSQIVNEHRIDEAARLLRGTNATVTDIQFDSGFQTKSNFNREFRRVTGMSPRAYRQSAL